MKTENIRNLNIMRTSAEANAVYQQIRKDDMLAEFPLSAIKLKGPENITLKCTNAETADNMSKIITEKYGGTIKIRTVQQIAPNDPKLFTNETHSEVILIQLKDQNPILKDCNITIQQFYETTTYKDEKYRCLIIATDLQTDLLLIFNISEVRIYEHVNLLQCLHCLRFGHIQRTCTYGPVCKKWTLNHKTSKCIASKPMPKMRYINCTTANKNGANYRTQHRPSDERCQARIERIDALKALHLTKN